MMVGSIMGLESTISTNQFFSGGQVISYHGLKVQRKASQNPIKIAFYDQDGFASGKKRTMASETFCD